MGKDLTVDILIDIARGTGVFREEELDILGELAGDVLASEETTYRMISQEIDGNTIGFIIFGRTPLTAFSWDIYWLVVDSAYQGFGTGKKLLRMAESEMLADMVHAVIRVETSSRKEYLPARKFYSSQGFTIAGSIGNFYDKDDDLVIYAKEITTFMDVDKTL